MKNLKRLIIVSALFGMAHGANAYEYEKDFEPVEKGDAEAQGIELVNGQLMVKSKDGRISDMEAPYTFVGTNTANFASSGFAIKEMADANSVVLNGSDVYFTRTSDTTNVYHLVVSEKPALNGVTSQLEKFVSDEPISALIAVKDGVVYGKNKAGDDFVDLLTSKPVTIPSVKLPASATNNLYSITQDGYVYVYEKASNGLTVLRKYNSNAEKIKDIHGWEGLPLENTKEMVVFDEVNSFILRDNNDLYKNIDIIQSGVTGIKAGKDGKTLLITSKDKDGNKVITSYNTKTGETKSVYSEENTKTFFAKSEIISNGVTYKVNGKKIGYSIAD